MEGDTDESNILRRRVAFCRSDRKEETESSMKQRRLEEKSINERMNTEELFDVVHGTDVVSCSEKDVPQREEGRMKKRPLVRTRKRQSLLRRGQI